MHNDGIASIIWKSSWVVEYRAALGTKRNMCLSPAAHSST